MEDPGSQHRSVRRSYDSVAKEYLASFGDELSGKPLDRALLACLAEQAENGAPIADVGCGPGHVAAWLAARGVTAVGIDLSPAMIATGRRHYPQVEFRQGDLLQLPAKTASSLQSSRSTRSSTWSPASSTRLSRSSTGCCGPAGGCSSHFISARR